MLNVESTPRDRREQDSLFKLFQTGHMPPPYSSYDIVHTSHFGLPDTHHLALEKHRDLHVRQSGLSP